jgi:hypothetical protein
MVEKYKDYSVNMIFSPAVQMETKLVPQTPIRARKQQWKILQAYDQNSYGKSRRSKISF